MERRTADKRKQRPALVAAAALGLVLAAVWSSGCGGPSTSVASPAPPATARPAASTASPAPPSTPTPPAARPSPTPNTSPGSRSLPPVAHIVLIVMENHSASQIIGSPDAPFITSLARRSSYAADYSALFHPSLPNYIALTSGSNQGITDDRSPPTAGWAVSAINLADRIESSGRTWKSYAESIPSAGFASGDTSLYATRHVPFLYYADILGDARRRTSHVVPFTDLPHDFSDPSTTPDFAFITPNLWNDMHDGPVSAGDRWLKTWVSVILRSPAFTSSPSLLVITWDEGVGSDQHVATILAGSATKPGYRSSRPYTHYSLLHTIEAAWGLQPLTGNDAGAAVMKEFLR